MLKTVRGVSPLWDLRRGDADDDRSSPYGRGWMSMIFSAALEFNYLTAPITFLLLVAGPALLVGLVPPLLATYGHWAATSTVRAHPAIAIPLSLVLLAIVFVVGQRLFPRTVDALWQLKYTLIFPLFIGLRELICVGLERLPGQLNTAEQFAQRRRIGAALAAMLLAGGAISVAFTVEFSSGGRLVAVFNPRLWGIARAALWNAVVVLAFWTAIIGIQWLWREISINKPIREWVNPHDSDGAARVRVAHLSDLHIVGSRYGFRMESGKRGPRGNGRVRRALHSLADMHAASPIDRVLVSGDITDAGTRAEWIEFTRILDECPELRAKCLFVPGNHDVNVVDPTNPGRLDLPGSMGQALRILRVVLALDDVQGGVMRVVDRASGALGPTLREYLRAGSRPELIRELASRGTRRGRREIGRVWDAIFPLVIPPPDEGGCGVMLLDSNARRHLSLTNAMGIVGRSQLNAMRSVLRSSRDRSWLVVLHHHIVEYPLPSIALSERIGLSLANASEVLAVISGHPSHVLILHGHRHRDWIGTNENLTLCSGPSVTLGSYNSDRRHGYFHVYEIHCANGGVMHLECSRVVAVA